MNTIIHRALLLTTFLASALHAATPAPPNLVVILADDLGFGDVSCFNPASKIATPHIDRLAREGIRFTDAHTASSVCTTMPMSSVLVAASSGLNRRLAS